MTLTQKQLDNALQSQNDKFQQMLDKSLVKLKEDIVIELSADNARLTKEVDELKNKVVELESELQNNFQYQRKNNVVIDGIPADTPHDDLEGIVIKIFNSVCFHSITTRDVVACHRISAKSSSVLTKFVNTKDASTLLDSYVDIDKMINSEVGLSFNNKITVSEHLTPYVANLAYRCRCLKRQNLIEKVKIQKGTVKILTKKDGRFVWHKIVHVNDINILFPSVA